MSENEALNEIKYEKEGNGQIFSNSVIGIKNSFSGEFRSDGLLRIDGDFKGTIRSFGTVLVGEKGRIIGDIYARSVRIGGKVKGSIYCTERVDILSTGKLIGNLWTKKFKGEEGMVFTGEAKILNKNEIDEIFHQNVSNSQYSSKEFDF
ncbi:MAG: bactofilin family protein [Brevinematia bacterium]